MKSIVILLLVALAASRYIREPQHQWWYTVNRKFAESKIPFADAAWNYCDIKCTSFEEIKSGYDFYVVNFDSGSFFKGNFAACYAKKSGSNTAQLWNEVVKNEWYEENCGKDDEDYLKNDKYKVKSEEGQGTKLINY